ncbi:manganese efflux pump [Halalkalibacter alkalisediminis]|uniref:Manganese efflux pump n=1 Tax=Halalkalibacter alkalisediminis TaxID=935616 RepID=A0ABV6NEJ6_9BACI
MAVSLDSFGIGITYGIRRIRIPFISLLVIMLISSVMVIVAMTMGTVIRLLLLPKYAEMIGGIILVLIGLSELVLVLHYLIIQSF